MNSKATNRLKPGFHTVLCHGLPRLSFGKSYKQNFLNFILVLTTCKKGWCPPCLYSKGVSQSKLRWKSASVTFLLLFKEEAQTTNLFYTSPPAMESPLRGHQEQELF